MNCDRSMRCITLMKCDRSMNCYRSMKYKTSMSCDRCMKCEQSMNCHRSMNYVRSLNGHRPWIAFDPWSAIGPWIAFECELKFGPCRLLLPFYLHASHLLWTFWNILNIKIVKWRSHPYTTWGYVWACGVSTCGADLYEWILAQKCSTRSEHVSTWLRPFTMDLWPNGGLLKWLRWLTGKTRQKDAYVVVWSCYDIEL